MQEQLRCRDSASAEHPVNTAASKQNTSTAQQQDLEPEATSVPLSHYLWILRRHVWKIVAFVLTSMLATFIVSVRLKPTYESTATVDVDRQAPTEIVGDNSTRGAVQSDADQFLATQIKLIQSDAVLRPVAEQYHLLGLEGQTHGMNPEKTQQAAGAPIVLTRLKVTRPPNTYLLLISYRSPDAQLAADVANGIANSYLNHIYDLRIRSSAGLSSFMGKQLDELKAKMEKSNLALAQYEKDLAVISPDEKTNILTARLDQLNTQYTTAQAERIRAEAAWNAIKAGSLGADEASPQGEVLARLTDSLNQARQRLAQVQTTFGSNHPEYRKAESELAEVEKELITARHDLAERIETQYKESLNEEQMFQAAVAETKAESDQINARSFEYQRLKQDADTDRALYDELIKKIREADINAGFQNSNIRVADLARPPLKPVFPNIWLNLEWAFVFSSLLAIGIAILMDSLDTTLRDPKEASRFLGVDVIATLPVDRDAARLPNAVKPAAVPTVVPKATDSGSRTGYYRTNSSFDEAIRTLRNTVLLSDFEGRLHSIVFTSAAPNEGKSTLAAHFAIANADHGKKTLIVDGDLRRPSLHSRFDLTPREGLSNVLNGEMVWQEVVIPIEDKPNLCLLPAGLGSHRAADLIGPRLATLLDEFAKEYDLVILDSPPLLGFAECLQMATAADGVLITTLAGDTRRRAVAEVIGALRRVHANIIGVVLNQVSHNTSAEGYSYYEYYHSEYYRRNA